MEYELRQRAVLKNESVHDYLKINSYENGAFILEGPTYFVGGCFVCRSTRSDFADMEKLYAWDWENELPKGYFLQIQQLWTSTVNNSVNKYFDKKLSSYESLSELIRMGIDEKRNSLKELRAKVYDDETGVRIRESLVIVSLKFDIGPTVDEGEVESGVSALSRVRSRLASFGLRPFPVDAESYIKLVRSILSMGVPPKGEYDENSPVRDSLVDDGMTFDVTKDLFQVTCEGINTYIKSASMAAISNIKRTDLEDAMGDFYGGAGQINVPYMVSLTLTDCERKWVKVKKDNRAESTDALLNRWVNFISAYSGESVEFGGQIREERTIGAWFNILLFDNSEAHLDSECEKAIRRFSERGLDIFEDTHFHASCLLNQLPLGSDYGAVEAMFRYKRMEPGHFAELAPIFSEWGGNKGDSALLFVSRRGHIVLTDYRSCGPAGALVGCDDVRHEMIRDTALQYMMEGNSVTILSDSGDYVPFEKMFFNDERTGRNSNQIDLKGKSNDYMFLLFDLINWIAQKKVLIPSVYRGLASVLTKKWDTNLGFVTNIKKGLIELGKSADNERVSNYAKLVDEMLAVVITDSLLSSEGEIEGIGEGDGKESSYSRYESVIARFLFKALTIECDKVLFIDVDPYELSSECVDMLRKFLSREEIDASDLIVMCHQDLLEASDTCVKLDVDPSNMGWVICGKHGASDIKIKDCPSHFTEEMVEALMTLNTSEVSIDCLVVGTDGWNICRKRQDPWTELFTRMDRGMLEKLGEAYKGVNDKTNFVDWLDQTIFRNNETSSVAEKEEITE